MPSPRLSKTPLFEVRHSDLHGNGCFAVVDINPGGWVAEYTGEKIDAEQALRRSNRREPGHTVMYQISSRYSLDGKYGNNGTAFMNHSCSANMQAVQVGNRIFFQAVKKISVGEELTFDYGLVSVDPDQLRSGLFRCKCGSKKCTGWLNAKVPLKKALLGTGEPG